jgi:hypothetical protein
MRSEAIHGRPDPLIKGHPPINALDQWIQRRKTFRNNNLRHRFPSTDPVIKWRGGSKSGNNWVPCFRGQSTTWCCINTLESAKACHAELLLEQTRSAFQSEIGVVLARRRSGCCKSKRDFSLRRQDFWSSNSFRPTLSRYKRSATEGREMGMLLSIKTNWNTITVIEKTGSHY